MDFDYPRLCGYRSAADIPVLDDYALAHLSSSPVMTAALCLQLLHADVRVPARSIHVDLLSIRD